MSDLQSTGSQALAKAPQPLRRALDGINLQFRRENGPTQSVASPNSRLSNLAGVAPRSPNVISVMDPQAFQRAPEQLVTHEGMHVWQNNLPPALQAKIPPDNPNDPYNYGGDKAVSSLLKAGKGLADMPKEQAAAAMQYGVSQGMPSLYRRLANTINDVPLSQIEMTDPNANTINTHPRAPQVPPSTVPGMNFANTIYQPGQPAPGDIPDLQPVDLTAMVQGSKPTPMTLSEMPAQPMAHTLSPLEQNIANDQQQLQKVTWAQQNPWGTKNNHPGTLGKIAHVLSVAGNIAGDIFAPSTMALVPGTELNREVQEGHLAHQLNAEQQEETENEARNAQTEEVKARTNQIENPRPEYQPLDTAGGIQNYDPHSGAITPLEGQGGQPVMPYTKPGPMQHVTVAGPDGKPMFANYQNGKYLDAQGNEIPNAQPYEKPQGEQHVAMLGDDGKPTFGNYSNGKWTDAQGRPINNPRPIPPPPSYGQLMLPTKTITAMVNGIPTIMQWDEQTQTYDKPAGQSATGGYGHEEAQAGAVQRAGQELIQTLQANRNNLGTLGAWVSKYGLNTPIADPKLAGIQAQLASFAALNPAMHGARGLHAMEHFEKLIGGIQNNPDAAIAGIQAIINTAGAINPHLQHPGGGSPASGPKAGEVVKGYRFKGGNPSDPKSWEKAQ